MDSIRANASRSRKITWILAFTMVFLALTSWVFLKTSGGVRVEEEDLVISTVKQDQFYEYINLDGRIAPAATYLVDSKVSGNVERIFVESGQDVKRGDTLLQISNADLELDVLQRESQLIEQLNNQRQTKLLLNQNDFNRREQLVEIDFQLSLQEKQFRRDTQLLAAGVIATSDFEPGENRFAYYKKRRALLSSSFRADSSARNAQLDQIDAFEARIMNNLEQVRAILDRLYILAAVDGRLSDFEVQTGQSVTSGQRIGEIYSLEDALVVAEIDEFYLDKIRVGQQGLLPGFGDSLTLAVSKIYPNVNGGRFRIEAGFISTKGPSQTFVKGQSVRFRLLFGEERSSVLLANGSFFGSTGGHWVYRLNGSGAERTTIRLGRSNPNFYEVLEGLEPGDRVIVSAYDNFAQYESIILN